MRRSSGGVSVLEELEKCNHSSREHDGRGPYVWRDQKGSCLSEAQP